MTEPLSQERCAAGIERRSRHALTTLHTAEIVGTPRDFLDHLDATSGALTILEINKAAVLRRRWSDLIHSQDRGAALS